MVTMREVGAAEWPAIAAGFADLGYEQTLAYAQAAARRIGGEARFAVFERHGLAVAAAAVRVKRVPGLRRGIAWIAGGPLLLPKQGGVTEAPVAGAVLERLRREFCERQGHILRLRAAATGGWPETYAAAAVAAGFTATARAPAYRTFILDLEQDEEALLKRLHGKWRTDLRFAQKSGLELERGMNANLQARFMAMLAALQSKKMFEADIAPAFHFDLAGPDYPLDILIASKDGVDAAGIVLVRAGENATYLFGATAETGRRLKAGYFLSWQGMLHARAMGCTSYDLGGVNFEDNPDVARFKERTGGEEVLRVALETKPSGLFPSVVEKLEDLKRAGRRRSKAAAGE